jgi:hypothetical protein
VGPIACVRSQGARSGTGVPPPPHVPLEGGRPYWRVWSGPGGWGSVGPPSVPQLQEKGAQQPPSGGCWQRRTISWKTYKTAQKPCIFSCIIWYVMFLQNSKLFRKFKMSDNWFEELGGLKWCRAVTALLHIYTIILRHSRTLTCFYHVTDRHYHADSLVSPNRATTDINRNSFVYSKLSVNTMEMNSL